MLKIYKVNPYDNSEAKIMILIILFLGGINWFSGVYGKYMFKFIKRWNSKKWHKKSKSLHWKKYITN